MTEDYKIILSVLEENGFETRIVGGTVRDIVIGKTPNDIDIATKATPTNIYDVFSIQNLKKYKIENLKIIPTGIKHGTLSIILNNNKYEITTLRSDYNTDGRHAEIKFETSWEKDAERRDFTFNALYMDINGKIYDYFKGIEDLKNKHIRFIGNPEKRISEDYLRILRYFRFAAQLECNIQNLKNSKDCNAIKLLSKNIRILSKERIRHELFKILASKNSLYILLMMYDLSVLENIIEVNTDIIYKIKSYPNISFISEIFEKIPDIGKILLLSTNNDLKKFFIDINIHKKEKKILYELEKPLPFKLLMKIDILKNILFLLDNPNIIGIMLFHALKLLLNKEISEKYMKSIMYKLDNINNLIKQNNFHISYDNLKIYNIRNQDISKVINIAKTIWSESIGKISIKECIERSLYSIHQ